ncbi:MAG: hypothetical protein M3Y87_27815 [Myxococcota bacterium]|nr:hypothetical protein [Myxococcota bacterium]
MTTAPSLPPFLAAAMRDARCPLDERGLVPLEEARRIAGSLTRYEKGESASTPVLGADLAWAALLSLESVREFLDAALRVEWCFHVRSMVAACGVLRSQRVASSTRGMPPIRPVTAGSASTALFRAHRARRRVLPFESRTRDYDGVLSIWDPNGREVGCNDDSAARAGRASTPFRRRADRRAHPERLLRRRGDVRAPGQHRRRRGGRAAHERSARAATS